MVSYTICLVCGRLTPSDKGICYHCHSPLPTEPIVLPPGLTICPNCLRVTAVDTGFCRHCRAPLPVSVERSPPTTVSSPPATSPPPSNGVGVIGNDPKVGARGRVYRVGARR